MIEQSNCCIFQRVRGRQWRWRIRTAAALNSGRTPSRTCLTTGPGRRLHRLERTCARQSCRRGRSLDQAIGGWQDHRRSGRRVRRRSAGRGPEGLSDGGSRRGSDGSRREVAGRRQSAPFLWRRETSASTSASWLADHLIHGWDLAVATGQNRNLDSELVAEVAAWFRNREEIMRSVWSDSRKAGVRLGRQSASRPAHRVRPQPRLGLSAITSERSEQSDSGCVGADAEQLVDGGEAITTIA